MPVSNTPMLLSRAAQDGVLEFYNQCVSMTDQQWNIRSHLEEVDIAYMREQDQTEENTKAKLANKYGDPTRFQNIIVPVVKPLVESAVTYQTSVFLTGNPIFGAVSPPEFMDEALQFNTVIEDQSVRGGWVSEFMKFFRDGQKYNLAAIEADWGRAVTSSLETDLNFSRDQAKPKEIIWEGNTIKHLDLYNTFFDTRVKPVEIPYIGEFAGYTKSMSRIALKQYIAQLPVKIIQNVIPAFESGLSTVGSKYVVPTLNKKLITDTALQVGTNWLSWVEASGAQNNIQYKNNYDVTVLYARILPADFALRVPSASTPQIWKFIVINHSVIIYAERQTNAHGLIPILFSQPCEDGLGYQTKSVAEDVIPMQSISSALVNSWIHSRRRAISDRAIYDPSRLASEHVNSPNPSAKIPIKPNAYGKPLQESYYQIPFNDNQAGVAMQEMQQIQQFAYVLTGQNPAKQGQFVKGNKTLHEYDDVMTHANGPDQKTALLIESQVMVPLKEILKINILQYQGGTSLFSQERAQVVKIDPIALRKAVLNFKISDGLAPSDKIIRADAFKTSVQVIGSSPAIGAGYNLAPMFSYLMKTQGADLKPFEKSPQQLAYETAQQQWMQLATLAIEKGQEFKQPQPKPQDYGYNPQTQGSAAAAAPAEVATRVNNITNNITNQEQ
jgi:hypothetical protein